MKNRRHCFNNFPRDIVAFENPPEDSLKLKISTKKAAQRKQSWRYTTVLLERLPLCWQKPSFPERQRRRDDIVKKKPASYISGVNSGWLTGRWDCEPLERRMPRCERFYFSWGPDAATPAASRKDRPLWSCPVHCCSAAWREHTSEKELYIKQDRGYDHVEMLACFVACMYR